jgi:hypothetical protein
MCFEFRHAPLFSDSDVIQFEITSPRLHIHFKQEIYMTAINPDPRKVWYLKKGFCGLVQAWRTGNNHWRVRDSGHISLKDSNKSVIAVHQYIEGNIFGLLRDTHSTSSRIT